MKGTKSKTRSMATLLCSMAAIAIGGIAADAWAAITVTNDGRWCYLCLTGAPADCNADNATEAHQCPEGFVAHCRRGGTSTAPSLNAHCIREATPVTPIGPIGVH